MLTRTSPKRWVRLITRRPFTTTPVQSSAQGPKPVEEPSASQTSEKKPLTFGRFLMYASGAISAGTFSYYFYKAGGNLHTTEILISRRLAELPFYYPPGPGESERNTRLPDLEHVDNNFRDQICAWFIHQDATLKDGVTRSEVLQLLGSKLGLIDSEIEGNSFLHLGDEEFRKRIGKLVNAFIENGSGRLTEYKRQSGVSLQETLRLLNDLMGEHVQLDVSAAEKVARILHEELGQLVDQQMTVLNSASIQQHYDNLLNSNQASPPPLEEVDADEKDMLEMELAQMNKELDRLASRTALTDAEKDRVKYLKAEKKSIEQAIARLARSRYMSTTPVGQLLLEVGRSLNRSPAQMEPYINTIVAEQWYDSLDSFRELVLSEDGRRRLVSWSLPQRLVDKLVERFESDSLPSLVTNDSQSSNDNSVIDKFTGINLERLISAVREEVKSAETNAEYMTTISTLHTIVRNLKIDSSNGKYRSIKIGNPKFQSAVARWPSAVAVLRAVGFELDLNQSIFCVTNDTVLHANVNRVAELLANELIPSAEPFNPYKESIVGSDHRAFVIQPERAAQIEAVKRETIDLKNHLNSVSKEIPKSLSKPILVHHSDKATRPQLSENDSEDDDTSTSLLHVRSIASASEAAQTFRSREKIELEKLKNIKSFSKCKVRVAFADKCSLELVVRANETVQALYTILAECLNSTYRNDQQWSLIVSPPVRKLERGSKSTMTQEGFLPSVIVRMMNNGKQCLSHQVLSQEYSHETK